MRLNLFPRFAATPVLHEQLQLIERYGVKGFLGSWSTGGLMGLVFWQLNALGAWLAWMAGHSLLMLLIHLFNRHARSDPQMTPERRARWLMGFTALIGAMWGGMTTLVWFCGADLPMMFMVSAVVAGITGGALGFCGHCRPVYLCYILFAVPLTSVGFLLHGGALAHTFFIFTISYLLFLLLFAQAFEQSTLSTIALRRENEQLLVELRVQAALAQEARALAETANIDKSRFLAAASHDLRQPIHALGLFLDALALTPLDEKQTAIFGHALTACDASRHMLVTLLDYSRLDARVVQPESRNFSLQSVLTSLAPEYAAQADEKGLVFRLRDTQLAAYADPDLVALVLRNLLTNAVRYTTHGGVLLACRKRGHQACVEVWDTGVGIPASAQQSVFQEFTQLDNPERDRNKGLGLGLAIVQRLCQVMQCTIELHSQPGRGTRFRLTLPLATGVVQDAITLPAADFAQIRGLRVLLVDDDDAVRLSTTGLLRNWGCHVDAVAAVAPEHEPLPAVRPHVVITDYRMHDGVTGKDVITALRQRWGSDLYCIIVTGDTAPDRLRDAQQTGAVLLHKPLSATQLLAALQEAAAFMPAAESQSATALSPAVGCA